MQPSLYTNDEAITLNKLTTVLTTLRNNRTPGEDSVTLDLLKCTC